MNLITSTRKNSLSSWEKIIACLVIPTYNEAENIDALLNKIYSSKSVRQYRQHHIELHVLIVDDSSPDGTANIVSSKIQENPFLHLLLRDKKDGLGTAYREGITHALSTIDPHVVFEMDADFSHDPSYILPMLWHIRDGADVVIGSRYVQGGSTPADWGVLRNLMSQIANSYAKLFLPFGKVKDCTGGFRAMRASLLHRVNFESLPAKGYFFQIVLLHALIELKAKIVEHPIHFYNRNEGVSKVSLGDIFEILLKVPFLVVRRYYGNPWIKKVRAHG